MFKIYNIFEHFQWSYSDFISIKPSSKPGSLPGEFVITVKKGGKADAMKFSADFTPDLITTVLRFRNKFAEQPVKRMVSLEID